MTDSHAFVVQLDHLIRLLAERREARPRRDRARDAPLDGGGEQVGVDGIVNEGEIATGAAVAGDCQTGAPACPRVTGAQLTQAVLQVAGTHEPGRPHGGEQISPRRRSGRQQTEDRQPLRLGRAGGALVLGHVALQHLGQMLEIHSAVGISGHGKLPALRQRRPQRVQDKESFFPAGLVPREQDPTGLREARFGVFVREREDLRQFTLLLDGPCDRQIGRRGQA